MSEQNKTGEDHRIERDFLGEVRVPAGAYYGAHTQRARENFPISGFVFPRSMIRALGLIKRCAAAVNAQLQLLDPHCADAISAAAAEVESGKHDGQFVVDIFQSGSGTSSNMNANEVISRRAEEIAGRSAAIHPNDHVNMGQSSNDVIPAAIHIALAWEIQEVLLPALTSLHGGLCAKSVEFKDLLKVGRTHLQDAVPITLGQEFSGYASQIEHAIARVARALTAVYELPLGGTAVGTGVNAHPEFGKRVIAEIARRTGLPFVPAGNSFEAQAARDALVEMSGQFKTIACSLMKVAGDIRWMGSGPRCGLGELFLPEVQPGSSIMPGKVNPVIAESLLMVCAQVIGNDAAITVCGAGGRFELNTMMPALAHNILQSARLLGAGARNFNDRCVTGLAANTRRLAEYSAVNVSICTLLAPKIGYDEAAALVREAYASGTPLRELVLTRGLLPAEELDAILAGKPDR